LRFLGHAIMLSAAHRTRTTRPEFTTLEVTGWQPQNNPPQKSLRPKNPLPRQPQANQL
jgi:hypothetical protein